MPELENQRQVYEFDDKAAAYFFAGEGYINIAIPNAKQKWYPSLRVGFVTTEKLWAELFHKRYGGFTWTAEPTKKTNRYIFGWRVTGKEAEAFLRLIQPFLLGEKVTQLEHSLRFREEAKKFYRKNGLINNQAQLWEAYRSEMKEIRNAAAETNRRDALEKMRSDSPNLEVIPVT
jgi:hypothetical protein